jgi:isopenicillin N synthase-like dioxygenase
MELQERAALNHGADYEELAKIHPEFFAKNVWPSKSLPSLEPAFCNMGRLLHQVGSLIAIVCDEYCKQNGIVTDLTKIITNSLNAKGRLLHYFPSNSTLASTTTEDSSDVSMETSWCGWHNDHGALTGLALPALYLDENQQEVIGRDALASAGLYVMARDGVPVRVELSKDVSNCCAFQIGETAQILSGGLLRATPHMVRAPTHSRSLLMTRSSFALFLQPEFHYPLCLPQKQNETGRTTMLQPDSSSLFPEDNDQNHRLRLSPLEHRWKNGQTFGEFHLATVSAFTVD